MRTVTLQSVLYSVARQFGLDPTATPTGNLETNVALSILDYINTRTREAWELWDFTELMVDDQRAFANAWNPTSTYTAGQIVYDWLLNTNAYYSSIGSTPANTAVTNTTYWTAGPTLPVPLTVPTYGQTGPTGALNQEIGTVFGVYSNDPYANAFPRPVNWTRTAKGITVYPVTYASAPVVLAGGAITYPFINLSTVYVLHRIPFPGFSSDQYSATVAYIAGNQVYYGTDTYQCILGNTGQLPSNVTYWTLVPFPYILSEFVKKSVYCDLLMEDGQVEKATSQLPNAYARLMNEFDRQTVQQGLTQRYSVITANN
jgi:hypothetical protein